MSRKGRYSPSGGIKTIADIITLAEMVDSEDAYVETIEGENRSISRMAAMGFTPGVVVTMVRNSGHKPVIVIVRDSRIALGRDEAAKIRVRRM